MQVAPDSKETWEDKFEENLLEILYRQDQCRVPAGSPSGGRFASCGPGSGQGGDEPTGPFSSAEDMVWERTTNASEAQTALKEKYHITKVAGLTQKDQTSVERANLVGESMEQIMTTLPDLRGRCESYPKKARLRQLVLDENDFLSSRTSAESTTRIAAYAPLDKGITLGNWITTQTMNELHIGKGHNVGLDFGTTMRHEYGHHVYHSILTDGQRRTWNKFTDEVGGQPFFRNNVSLYSSISGSEAFAETFAAYSSPLYGTGPNTLLPSQVERTMKDLVGARAS